MFLLAKRWNESINPTGYWVSEKLDGFRAMWSGRVFISRQGNEIQAPDWFTKELPSIALDGELWAGRGNIGLVTSAVNGSREKDWERVVFCVFDAQEIGGPFEKRLEAVRASFTPRKHSAIIYHSICAGKAQLLKMLDEVVAQGGEGLVLRRAGSFYERKRSDTFLKVKKWFDAEATVIAHVEGTRPGLCGALKVINKEGKIFKVASGMTEAMAHSPPPIGTIITYKWDTLTKDGIPRPASFVRIREDI